MKPSSQSNGFVPMDVGIGEAFMVYAGLLDGLLGVAGMRKLLVMTGIIPENSLPPGRL